MRNRIAPVVAALAAAAVAPSSALAHVEVTGRTPAPSASLTSVRSVKITFSEAVVTGKLTVSKAGRTVGTGLLVNRNTGISANFARSLVKGTYTATWRLLGDDGHRQSGSWTFTVR